MCNSLLVLRLYDIIAKTTKHFFVNLSLKLSNFYCLDETARLSAMVLGGIRQKKVGIDIEFVGGHFTHSGCCWKT